jgi:hypothetical protein
LKGLGSEIVLSQLINYEVIMLKKSLHRIKGMEEPMKPKYTTCILLTAVALLIVSGCIAQDKIGTDSLKSYLPLGEKLPEGFKLIVIEDKSLQGLNMTGEIKDFYGIKDIGPVNATLARYNQSSLGDFKGDAKVTLIALKDEDHAKAAVSNYLENFKSSNTVMLPGNRSLIRSATFNGHEMTVIGSIHEKGIQYLYLWNNKTIAVLVEGNFDENSSMKLARATGL